MHIPRLDHRSLVWLASIALSACTGEDVGTGSESASSTGSTATGLSTAAETTTSTTPETMTSTTSETVTSTTSETMTSTSGGVSAGTTTTTTTTTTGTTTTGTPAGECGDSVVDDGEECDDGNLDDDDACTSQCLTAVCGDGIVQTGVEACDGAELGGETCASLGFSGGQLGCLDTCTHDTSNCAKCGDGEVDDGEECDDGNTEAGDGCDEACLSEPCDPDGTYTIQGAPVAYTCCSGLVTVNVNTFLLSADGASIASSPSNPIAMTGAATTCPDGEFSNQGTIPGGCTEGYAVEGSFDDQNTWTGTYAVTFEGEDCSCFNGQLGTPCVGQVFPITAKR